MRIIGGRWRSRKIGWPDTGKTRPITDRVKLALFDILGSFYDTPGGLPDLQVADVFAGGGSLGLEALSRGASRAVFYEQDRRAVAVLKQNMEHLEVGAEGVLVAANLWRKGVVIPSDFGPHDLVFMDPPFREAADLSASSRMGVLLERLRVDDVTHANALLVFRHDRATDLPEHLPGGWRMMDQRTYGRNVLSLFKCDV